MRKLTMAKIFEVMWIKCDRRSKYLLKFFKNWAYSYEYNFGKVKMKMEKNRDDLLVLNRNLIKWLDWLDDIYLRNSSLEDFAVLI